MNRKALNLLVDGDLVKKARNHGLNLSRFFENKLQEYFNFIKAVSYNSQASTNASTDPWGFEPQLSAPKADRISRLPYGPKLDTGLKN